MTDLGALEVPTNLSYGNDVNLNQVVVGYSVLAEEQLIAPFYWSNGTMTALNPLVSNRHARAEAISNGADYPWAVGWALDATTKHAVYWNLAQGPAVTKLQDLLSFNKQQSWQFLEHASDINFAGQICGVGLLGDDPQTAYWTPFIMSPPICGSTASCDDFDWCSVDACWSGMCDYTCVPRCYGNVRIDSVLNLDDILAVMACYGGNCVNCGYPGSGRRSGCDIKSSGPAPLGCEPDQIISIDDITAVLNAFSGTYACQHCCGGCGGGGGFAPGGGEESGGGSEQRMAAISEMVGFLATGEASDPVDSDLMDLFAEVFGDWCLNELTEDEIADTVNLLSNSTASAFDSVFSSRIEGVIKKLSN